MIFFTGAVKHIVNSFPKKEVLVVSTRVQIYYSIRRNCIPTLTRIQVLLLLLSLQTSEVGDGWAGWGACRSVIPISTRREQIPPYYYLPTQLQVASYVTLNRRKKTVHFSFETSDYQYLLSWRSRYILGFNLDFFVFLRTYCLGIFSFFRIMLTVVTYR